MSQIPAPSFKLKLKTSKNEDGTGIPPVSAPSNGPKPIDTTVSAPKDQRQPQSLPIATNPSKPSGIFKLKIKQPTGTLPLIGSQKPSVKRPAPTNAASAPKKPKPSAKPAHQFTSPLGATTQAAAQQQNTAAAFPPQPKLKLKLGSFASVVGASSAPGSAAPTPTTYPTLMKKPGPGRPPSTFSSAATGFAGQPYQQQRQFAQLGPKKRGRGRPPNIGGRPPRRADDEVRYHIPAVQPRSFSLRQAASQNTLISGGGGGGDAAPSPLSVGGQQGGALGVERRKSENHMASPSIAGGGSLAGGAGGTSASPTPVVLEPFGEQPTNHTADDSSAAAAPTTAELEKLLTRIWEKDSEKFFRQPVTDEVAPGYSTIITQPMDLSTMRTHLEQGKYTTWKEISSDLELMFANALTYNSQGDNVWKYAYRLRNQASTMLKNARQGKSIGGRSATAMAKRKETAAARAADRAKRDALRAAQRAEQRAAQEAKVLKRAGISATNDADEENTARATYRQSAKDAFMISWGGLGGGASGEGAPLGWGPQIIRPVASTPHIKRYAASLLRFAAKLGGKARDIVLARVSAVENASEELGPMPPPQQQQQQGMNESGRGRGQNHGGAETGNNNNNNNNTSGKGGGGPMSSSIAATTATTTTHRGRGRPSKKSLAMNKAAAAGAAAGQPHVHHHHQQQQQQVSSSGALATATSIPGVLQPGQFALPPTLALNTTVPGSGTAFMAQQQQQQMALAQLNMGGVTLPSFLGGMNAPVIGGIPAPSLQQYQQQQQQQE